MAWNAYAGRTLRLWERLLARTSGEREVQRFLETHPSLVPGSRGEFGGVPSGHGPFPAALISQPPLQALGSKRPDFMWIARDSGSLVPVLIEIESPRKKWLNRDGVQNAKLTQALSQLQAWRKWFNDPDNRRVFLGYYEVPALVAKRRWAPVYVLIYGRRNERGDAERAQAESDHRAYLRKPDEFHITFDHLSPNPQADELVCVRNTRGRYKAISIPPTVRLRSDLAEYRSLIKKQRAAMERGGVPKVRQDYLLKHFVQSDAWAKASREGWPGPHEAGPRTMRSVEVLRRLTAS